MPSIISLKAQPNLIPQNPGVYLFKDQAGNNLYIGKAKNLRNRVKSYFLSRLLLPRTELMLKKAVTLDFIKVESEFEALLLEAALINKFQPNYNVISKDDKSPLYITISREKFPRVRTARLRDLKLPALAHPHIASVYGPFPTGTSARLLLRRLRRIFPYCEAKGDIGRPCLPSHLGLCNPCPRYLSAHPNPQLTIKYKNSINHLKQVLSGHPREVIKRLAKKMNQEAAERNFESAAQLRDQILKLQLLTQPSPQTEDYLANPNLLEDQARESLDSLETHLRLSSHPNRIECYDVSHTGRTQATAAMVVALGGSLDSGHYRHFKIIFTAIPNDTAAIAETLNRRLHHPEWGIPDLIVIDGGKAQLSAAKKVLDTSALFAASAKKPELVALAKRREEIFLSDGSQVLLAKSDPGMRFLVRLRNEAHRFSRRLHHRLRSKYLFS